MAISFDKLQVYLDGIAAAANLDVGNSRHGAFWRITYQEFRNGIVPTKKCDGQPVPLINSTDPERSAFFIILQSSFCGMPKMPKTGPFLTDSGSMIQLSDGSNVTGQKIIEDIREWLQTGFPENG